MRCAKLVPINDPRNDASARNDDNEITGLIDIMT